MTPAFPRIENPIVGRYYRVPCVLAIRGVWLPIIGPKHEDREFIGFAWEHYHYDFRFISRRVLLREFGDYYGNEFFSAVATDDKYFLDNVVLHRRRCAREMPEYPHTEAFWLPQLELAYAGRKMKCMTCPHRGIPLNGLPVKDGVVTCPGHGLRWRIDTGELVRTKKAVVA